MNGMRTRNIGPFSAERWITSSLAYLQMVTKIWLRACCRASEVVPVTEC